MANVRVHELAKQAGVTSKEMLETLKKAGIEAKTASSSVDEAAATKALKNGAAKPAAQAEPRPAAAAQAKPPAPAPAPAAPAKPAARYSASPDEPLPRGQGAPRPGGQPQGGPRPAGQGGPRPAGQGGQRPSGQGGQRPAGQGGPRPGGQGGSRPGGQGGPRPGGQGGPRPGGQGGPRPGGQGGQRPAGQGGGGGAGKMRRVVIDSQASRRGPGGPPPTQPARKPRGGRRRRPVFEEPAPRDETPLEPQVQIVKINSGATVKEVSESFGIPAPDIIKKLMDLGEMATLTQTLSDEAIGVLAQAFEKKVDIATVAGEGEGTPVADDDAADLAERPPVVTIMGHVDHGKTSLLDAIREADVVAGEAGGITQHIGAYQVHRGEKLITFIDTPGHEAFTAMRARGASVTDVAVIVVAADDGVMPQTEEAIDHAKAAGVPMVIAVNKIDKEGADPSRVRTELAQLGLQPEDWGGETIYCDVSAKQKQGLENLLDMLLLVSEVEELRGNPETEASGAVIESKLDPGRGPVVTVLIQRGRLNIGDAMVAGSQWGRVRAMQDSNGHRLKSAELGMPVEVLGFDGVPEAGQSFRVVKNERLARQMAGDKANRLKTEAIARKARVKVSLEDAFAQAQEGTLNELNLVLKGDVAGSVGALEDEIAKLPQSEIKVNVIHHGVGGITESDVMLASASSAIVIGFNVRPVGDSRLIADREGVEIRTYTVIYKAIEELRSAMEGLLEPEEVEESVGSLTVRQTFKASKIGTIAGCHVDNGKVTRGASVRLVRDGTVIYEGKIDTLRRFNDDVREVTLGMECGVVLENYSDVKDEDVIEVYEIKSVERELV